MKRISYYIKEFKSFLRQHGFVTKKSYFTMHLRPKRASAITAFIADNMPNVGIVIQGPLKQEDDFTKETIMLYRKYYPQSPIIVSTWDTESKEDLNWIKDICGENGLCVSHFDKSEGNFQRTTSLAGIKKAKEVGCDYVLKTRTDQRIYASQILSFLVKLVADFPLKIKCKAKGRIVACELDTFSNRQYNISDMMIFGYAEDVLRYFSCPADNRSSFREIENQNFLQYQADYSKLRLGEIWFASHYIESLGFELKWTFEDSDYYRNELFIIVDNSTLELFWPKYLFVYEYRWKNYNKQDVFHQVSFKEWYISQLN